MFHRNLSTAGGIYPSGPYGLGRAHRAQLGDVPLGAEVMLKLFWFSPSWRFLLDQRHGR